MKQNFDISCLMIGMKLRKLNTNGDVLWAESKIREVKRLKVV